MNYTTKLVSIYDVLPGDTIQHNGNIMTVCKSDIKHCKFMGRTIFGDSYHLGHKPVIMVKIH